ncbi:DoxX family protein [Nocardia sp. SSK8]|uniref:DoxX family protein n=1 Tax=Nocardia sp. SSK8 TaxID=3120154 RepID=UPI00300ACC45
MAGIAEDVVLLLVRILVSVAFFASSRNKFGNMRTFAAENGVPLPVAYAVAVAEMCGAIGLFFGIVAPAAAVGVMALMVATISLHILKWHSPYWADKGGWEYDAMLFALAGVVAVFGAGTVSVDGLRA